MTNYQNNKNTGVQLITYADSLGRNLKDLDFVLDNYFKDIIQGVHILPFYPSSFDRGFSPLTHRKIDPRFGNKKDLEKISKKYNLMADLIVNHISTKSKYFQDYLAKEKKSKYKNFFIKSNSFSRHLFKKPKTKIWRYPYFFLGQISTFFRHLDFIFHKHGANRLILKKIYRPRPGSPFVRFNFKNSKSHYIWCTFSQDQIDLNIKSQGVKQKFLQDLKYLEKLDVKYIRLDAVAYVGKKRGTNSFLIPETILFIKWLAKHAHKHNMQVIPEVHFNYKSIISLAEMPRVDYVYDFALPFLMLQALFEKNTVYLKKWIEIRPKNSISNLDTHDGIGVIDVEDLLPKEEIKKTSEEIFKNGGNTTFRASGENSKNVDIYQINCTYYSALGKDKKKYLIARAIQLFLPGIPQIYYVGLLAGENDAKLLSQTQNGRDINRHYYKIADIKKEIKKDVVQKLFSLCRLRNTHLAFKGKYILEKTSANTIQIKWKNEKKILELKVNFKKLTMKIVENSKKVLFEIK